MNTAPVDATGFLRPSAQEQARPAKREPATRAPEAVAAEAAPKPANEGAVEQVRRRVEAAMDRIQGPDRRLSFQVDEESGRTVILVRDAETAEVLKQIPAEELLAVARHLEAHVREQDAPTGVLVSDQV